ncbi:Na(+)-translocating NADH-quinone reductase subunit F [Sungkyunkwania multivorans]|uniref:Na(+)-translocating NADH-quinone reductase subunit F n=1 Tax=Sungkyunkwania multivorans TaxID=1173618 RepID=A0ABW3D1H1_9FLAO
MLSEREIHYLAMNLVGKELEKEGFEFLSVNSKLKKNPQFVCLREKKLHFVLVRAILHPNDPNDYDVVFMQTMKEHAEKFEAKMYYAGVGLVNANDKTRPLVNGEPYIIDYNGLKEIV